MYDVKDVAQYVIQYSNQSNYGISNLKLQKILYLIQAYFLLTSKGERQCFREIIEAWDFGPVVPSIYEIYACYGSTDIPTPKQNDFAIAKQDKKLIQKVVDEFSDYAATDLVFLTQHQDPWMKAYVKGEQNKISTESITKFFKR